MINTVFVHIHKWYIPLLWHGLLVFDSIDQQFAFYVVSLYEFYILDFFFFFLWVISNLMIDVANLSLIYLQKYVMANREDDVGKKSNIAKLGLAILDCLEF